MRRKKSAPGAREKLKKSEVVFALDIGTRSVVGVVGRAAGDRLEVLALEQEEHQKRSMLDGQIDDIRQVAQVARRVTQRLEKRMGISLERVCVAAAGRALRTESGSFSLELAGKEPISAEEVSRLEAGAVSCAEEALQKASEGHRQFFLVGYTVSQYRLDHYPLSTLLGHSGTKAEADVVATFLPGEVVESLYAAMHEAGLQVGSMTLEPIAAMNAAIPAQLRLLNLALVDIGAGTTDIAICRDGSVVGYTMVTVAGDETTEALMRAFLVDFQTAERIKRSCGEDVPYTDILGVEQTARGQDIVRACEESMHHLAQAVAREVTAVNGGPPSAVFLAGGGSRLFGLREKVAECLQMDEKRVAIAGSNFEKSAFSKGVELGDPAYATPLGIAVSAGLGLLNDSYVVTLNGQRAKLFRSGSLTLRDVLLMNGYTYQDLLGRTGRSLAVTLDGRRLTWRGEPAAPAVLTVNGEDAPLTAVIHAGDRIHFVPARSGADVSMTLGQLLGEEFAGSVLVNNQPARLKDPLHQGDVVLTAPAAPAPNPRETGTPPDQAAAEKAPPAAKVPGAKAAPSRGGEVTVELNGKTLSLPAKDDGAPYYLMDLLDHAGIDFKRMDRAVELSVNGEACGFRRTVRSGDSVRIS